MMIFRTEDDLEVYYEVSGNLNSANTLVFLNGLTQSTLSWAFVLPYFQNDYRLVCMDFIFQGQSDKSPEFRTFDQHAADVARLLDFLSIKNAVIIGLSYGSLVAQHMAVLFPEKCKGIILISTFAHKTPIFNMIENSWWNALERGGYGLMFDTMMPFVLSDEYFSNPIIPVDLLKKSREDLNQNSSAIFKLMRATKERADYRSQLLKVNCPTLVIQGEKDLLLPVDLAKEVSDNIKGSKLITIPNAGHTLNLEHVSEVCTHIKSFLSQLV